MDWPHPPRDGTTGAHAGAEAGGQSGRLLADQARGQAARGDGNRHGRTGLEEDQREAAQPPEVEVCLQRWQGGGARAGGAQAREAAGEFDGVVGLFTGGDRRAAG